MHVPARNLDVDREQACKGDLLTQGADIQYADRMLRRSPTHARWYNGRMYPESYERGGGGRAVRHGRQRRGNCEYMASKDIALMGGDASSNDAQPSGEFGSDYAVHCHTEMQTRRGIWNIENLDLKLLVDAKVYEFAFIWAPLKIIGGTGSPGNPIAIH